MEGEGAREGFGAPGVVVVVTVDVTLVAALMVGKEVGVVVALAPLLAS